MTGRELYLWAKGELARAGTEEPGADASLLCGRFLGLDRPGLALHGGRAVPEADERALRDAVARRAERVPIQYILGEWPFMSLTLSVGEGVLVPREDTAVLVEALAKLIPPSARGLDLCAGTGAVGLGICSLVPGARVRCVELDKTAMGYLQENLGRYPEYACTAASGDVLAGPQDMPSDFDFIASNPPYIASGELPTLQPEVQKEPPLALEGGPDGLTFYRAIADRWTPLLRPGGAIALEIGETQAGEVTVLLARAGFESITTHKDLSGLDRAVTAIKKEK